MRTSRKKYLAIGLPAVLVAAVAALAGWSLINRPKNPVPSEIKAQYSFQTVYPAQANQIVPASFQFQSSQQTLSFNINYAGQKVVFTEQPAPSSLGANGQVYYPAIGVHPYAQFVSKLGPVALAKFWQSGNLTPAGESAILDTNGTLLIAHSDQGLTNEQWKDLVNSLDVSK